MGLWCERYKFKIKPTNWFHDNYWLNTKQERTVKIESTTKNVTQIKNKGINSWNIQYHIEHFVSLSQGKMTNLIIQKQSKTIFGFFAQWQMTIKGFI